jgi:hypothetical protein
MPRGPSEETQVYQVRIANARAERLKQEAQDNGNRPIAHVLREIIEDHISTYDLPPSFVEVIEADRKKRKQTKREYMLELLDRQYRELIGAKGSSQKK